MIEAASAAVWQAGRRRPHLLHRRAASALPTPAASSVPLLDGVSVKRRRPLLSSTVEGVFGCGRFASALREQLPSVSGAGSRRRPVRCLRWLDEAAARRWFQASLEPLPEVPVILQKVRAVHPGPGLPPVIRATHLCGPPSAGASGGAAPSAASPVTVVDAATGERMGWGLWNPYTHQYRIRVISSFDGREPEGDSHDLVAAALRARIQEAVALRRLLGLPGEDTDVFRLVNREGDHLSGLAVDAIGADLVVRSSALWAEVHRSAVVDALRAAWPRGTIHWQGETDSLAQDGFEKHFGCRPDAAVIRSFPADGSGADSVEGDAAAAATTVVEAGVRFLVSPASGKKTGHFADQRENRRKLRHMLRDLAAARAPADAPLKVLDLFSYSGGFAVAAALGARAGGGAAEVTAVDMDAAAVECARQTASANGVEGDVRVVEANAFTFLQEEAKAGRLYDVVVCDPPRAVCSSGWGEEEMRRAIGYHRRITRRCLRVVRPGGLLVVCTCSQVLAQARNLLLAARQAAAAEGRGLRLLQRTGAGEDHVLHPAWRPEGHLDVLWFAVA
eukprot:TRINITY_DN18397_c0_g1_i1.p1 TRINITY_DN18397_c0_g1~~TRINITY_DN18397_c0_g1_i1.p1  ORF type:complete len:561 (-),score=119.72 TRINITY_DN18397_c0_g1_i1:246-1928(-)